jgi:hypothetical protein
MVSKSPQDSRSRKRRQAWVTCDICGSNRVRDLAQHTNLLHCCDICGAQRIPNLLRHNERRHYCATCHHIFPNAALHRRRKHPRRMRPIRRAVRSAKRAPKPVARSIKTPDRSKLSLAALATLAGQPKLDGVRTPSRTRKKRSTTRQFATGRCKVCGERATSRDSDVCYAHLK